MCVCEPRYNSALLVHDDDYLFFLLADMIEKKVGVPLDKAKAYLKDGYVSLSKKILKIAPFLTTFISEHP